MSAGGARAGACGLALVLALAAATDAAAQGGATHLVVVGGLGGEPQYVDAFHAWGVALVDAARERYGLAPGQVTFLAEKPERDPARIDGRSTKEGVEAALTAIAGRAGPEDQVIVVLFAHGSAGGEEARLNLPGPDMTAADFARLLDRFPTQTVVLVHTGSASGGFIEPLSGPNRAIITATRSGMERNATLFGEFFVEALTGDGADVDKDGRVSLLEAFEYARIEVERVYREEDRLRTEHALLDDNGDGIGSPEPDPRAADGALARTVFFRGAAGPALAADASPELRALYDEKQRLEGRIAALRARREEMEAARYEAELEELLVELALTDRAIRALEEGTP